MTFMDYLRRLKWRFWVWVGLYILLIFGITGTSVFNGNAITALTKFNVQGFLHAAGWYAAATILEVTMSVGTVIYQYHLQRLLDNDIRSDIAANFTQMTYPQYHQRADAVYTSWLTNDINTLNTHGLTFVGYIIQASCQVTVSVAVLVTYHVSLLITTAISAVFLLTVPLIYRQKLSAASAKLSERNERLTDQITDVLEGFNTLFMANRRHLLVQRIWQASDNAGKAEFDYQRFDMFTQFVINVVNLTAQLALLVQAGLLAYRHAIPVGAVITIASLSGTAFSGLTLLSFGLTTVKSVKPIFAKFAQAVVPAPPKKQAVQPLQGTIRLADVTFHYPGNNVPTISHLNLTIGAHQKIAIVGPSGKGKSTMLKLLSAILPDYQGQMTWDGQDYATLDPDTLRNQLTYIDQAPYIFNDTIRFNITLGQAVSDSDLKHAVAASQLTDFVAAQPQGLDTVLAHDGTTISGGQKQRIALARGLLRQSKIILSDEGTAALDPENAVAVERLLVTLPDTTLIMVTHNLRDEIRPALDQVITL